ncbi:S8 family serine peptidase [Neiella marina]|uniref:S8 family serine peptidase n=1 Tax=Neiella holothuriorum TaxID=2870530 RepID=A0ABS7EIN1_9GAMM|nr:S8 family serine peptidase [Neiella holothuriorum]MBW8192212.1 S8 family serine peptidase [Neiella holothuriorum]
MHIKHLMLPALLLACSTAGAQASDDVQTGNVIAQGDQLKKLKTSYKKNRDNLYFIQFNDEPLASYKGGISNLAATSLNAAPSNRSASGQLDVHSAVSLQYKGYLAAQQAQALSSLSQKLSRKLNVKHSYQTVLNAVAVELEDSEVKAVMRDASVRNVEKIGMHYLHTANGPSFIQAPAVWSGEGSFAGSKGEGVIVGIIDTGINAAHPSFADVGADGYDHTNPLGEGVYLGDCVEYAKFCNDKLIGIVSYSDIIDYYPEVVNPTEFDDIDDKLKVGYDFQGHGSHVASTAAGNILHDVNYYMNVTDDEGSIGAPSSFNFDMVSGVAPHANIVSYQVCDLYGCYPELTALAVEHAIENGVNVMNYSIGGSARDPWSSVDAEAFLNAREAGIHVATSAGNSGPDPETIGAPGNAPWITTVAAYTHDRHFTPKMLTAFEGGQSILADIEGVAATTGYSGKVVLAADYDDAGCLSPFAANTFNGEIVVCERGDIARVRKGLNVQEGGAGGLILMNVDGGAETLDADNHIIPAIHINAEDGQLLVDWLSEGNDHSVTITASSLTSDPDAADVAGAFTSRGPNLPYANIFSPDIAGPGVDIYAADAEDKPFDSEGGNIPYVVMSGTSMSSPHVAGALALIHSVHPDWTPAQVQSAVMGTAHRLTYTDDEGTGDKVRSDFFSQGAGSIRIQDAIHAGLILDITYQEYLSADPYAGGDPTTLNSTSIALDSCLGTCEWQRTVTATADGTWTANYEYLNPGFELTATPSQFTLEAGESQTITFSASSNIELEDESVHGYVIFESASEALSDTHFQATIGFRGGEIAESVSASLNNVDNTIVIKDVVTSGSNDLQARGFGLFEAVTVEGTAQGASNDSERNSPARYQSTIFSHQIIVEPYTKKLVVEIIDSTAPDMDLYVGIDENDDGKPDSIEMYYSLLCVSGREDSAEYCELDKPPVGNYWIFAHNFAGSSEFEPDSVTIRIGHLPYRYTASFDIDAPTVAEESVPFDVTLAVNGYLTDNESVIELEAGKFYYGLLEMGTTESLKTNIGTTVIGIRGLAPVNSAPMKTEMFADQGYDIDGDSLAISIDLNEWFSDADGDDLSFDMESELNAEISDGILTATLTEAAEYTVQLTVSDGSNTTSESFVMTVTKQESSTQPDPSPVSGGSGGGTFGVLSLLMAGGLLAFRRRLKSIA